MEKVCEKREGIVMSPLVTARVFFLQLGPVSERGMGFKCVFYDSLEPCEPNIKWNFGSSGKSRRGAGHFGHS